MNETQLGNVLEIFRKLVIEGKRPAGGGIRWHSITPEVFQTIVEAYCVSRVAGPCGIDKFALADIWVILWNIGPHAVSSS